MNRLWACGLTLALGVLVHPPINAEIRYVTDSVKLPMRSGGSATYRILRMISSGTPVEVLETNDEGFVKVRTPDRAVGWMLARDLMTEASPRERVLQLEERIAVLEEENQRLRGENQSIATVRTNLAQCTQSLTDVREAAAQTLEIEARNRQLNSEVMNLQDKLQALEAQNIALQGDTSRNWFLAGAGAVGGGLILGLVIPLIPRKRRRRWDQL